MFLYRMAVQHVDSEVIGREVHGLEDLVKGHDLVVDLAHPDIRVRLDALLDEAQQVLLVHAGRAVDVGVNLENIFLLRFKYF